MAVYYTQARVRGAHCDHAGALHNSRYFELVNQCIEDWFAEAVDLPFDEMHAERELGIPAVQLNLNVVSPCRLGDLLRIQVEVLELGRKALTLALTATADDAPRFRAELTIVVASTAGARPRSIEIPPPLREKMAVYLAAEASQ
jgi:4-hydroxybenzoyl-CoA thioesterase